MPTRPLAGLDANLLVVLDVLVETASVARTAKELGLTASAVSHALSRLRRVLGDPILVRAGRRMVTTARARALAPALRQGLALVASAVAEPAPFAPDQVERDLRIGAIDFATNHVLPALLDVLRREAPGVNVVVSPYDSRVLDDLGTSEVSLVLALRRARTKLRQAPILREAFVSVVRRGHEALRERMTAKRFASLPHALVSSTLKRRGAVDDALARHGLSRRVALVVPTFGSAAVAVAESDMVLTGSRREAERAARHLPLVLFDPPVEVAPFALSLFWHERDEKDPFLSWVRGRLLDVTKAARRGQ